MSTYSVKTINGIPADSNGAITINIPSNFSKNLAQTVAVDIFLKNSSISGDIILANTAAGSGKIYPSTLDTNTQMNQNDIIETTFILKKLVGPSSSNYVLSFDFWVKFTAGGALTNDTSATYTWDTTANPTLLVKIILVKGAYSAGFGYALNYVILINGTFVYASTDMSSFATADVRMSLTNNNAGTNNIDIVQYLATNIFTPAG